MKERIIREEFERTKEDLDDLEAYIEGFSSFLPLAVCTVNPPKIIIDVNRAFENLTGYKSIEIIGKALGGIFLEKREVDELLDKIPQKGKTETKELTLIPKEKKEIPVAVSLAARKDEKGNFIGCFLALSDITETKRLREGLETKVRTRTKELEEIRAALMNILEDVEETRSKAEEERNKTLAIINNFVDGLLVFDKEGKLTIVNPEAERFLEVKSEDITGKTFLELGALLSSQPLAIFFKKGPREVSREEAPLREDLILEVSTVSIKRDEEKIGTVVIFHNVTREKVIEKLKTEFVSLSAHQLRTPLSAIKWALKMFLDGDLGPVTKEQREYIEKTYSSNERMIALINDLLDITRIEEGRYIQKPVRVNVVEIIQSTTDSLREEIGRKNLKLEFKKSKEKLPKATLDVGKMKLAIQNILDNAIRYTLPGGKVTIAVKYVKKEIEVSIKDTGIGIPKDQQKRVFSKFFRGTNATSTTTEGTGLGLFIAKNIIEAHGGKVWFESEENKGTTFYLTIPIKEKFGEFLKEF